MGTAATSRSDPAVPVSAGTGARPGGVPARHLAAVSGVAGVSVAAIAAGHGGYAPTAWGWCVLAFAWLGAMALVLRGEVSLSRLELGALTLLAVLVAWTGASIAWSADVPQSVFELERGLVYLTGLAAVLLALRPISGTALLGGLLGGIVAISAVALGGRLLSGDAGADIETNPLNRMTGAIGYWNAMGIFAALGVLLALGLAARSARPGWRAAAAACLPLLLVAQYFTYSRGAWIALAIGAVAALALDPRRVQLATTMLLLSPPSVAAVLAAYGKDSLKALNASSDVVTREGRSLALVLAGLAALSALIALAAGLVESRARIAPAARTGWSWALAVGLVVALAVTFARFGDPVTLAGDAYGTFTERSDSGNTGDRDNVDARLFTLRSNGRIDYWEVTWRQRAEHPLRGTGAGTFEQYWLRERNFSGPVRDAHGLYAETVGELGWIGLALLVGALALPAAAALAARRNRVVPAAFGAYVAFLVHAGVDWDWEIPAVTLTGLGCGAALLVCARGESRSRWRLPVPVRAAGVLALVAAAVFSLIGLMGNRALAGAESAADDQDHAEAEREARKATDWAPWSAEAWQLLGNAQAASGRREEARTSLRRAIEKSPGDWRLWYDLGTASSGADRVRAYRRAAVLNPLEPDIQTLRDQKVPIPPRPETP